MTGRWATRLLIGLLALTLVACGTTGASGGRRSTPRNAKAADIQVQLGSSYMQQGKLDLALEKLTRAVQLDPRSAMAHSVLAILYEQIKHEDRAAEHYAKSVTLPNAGGDVRNNYGQFLCRRQRFVEADAQFQSALKDPFYKAQAVVATNAGICARNAGDLERAEDYLRAALQQQPDYAAALLPMASVLKARGQHLNARAFVQRFEATGQTSAEMLALGVEVEQALGDQGAAADYRARLLREFPASPEARRLKE